MNIYRGFDKLSPSQRRIGGTVVTIGTFDGVHTAHAEILKTLVEEARRRNATSAVVTFSPHPRALFSPHAGVRLLSDEREKARLIEAYGVDLLIVQPFTQAFAALSAEEFLREDLVGKLDTTLVVTGYDHSFGREKYNAFDFLTKVGPRYGVEAIRIPRLEIGGITVSSSSVRRAVEGGDIALARTLLGRPYSLYGTVVRGKQLGRTLGYPTANIRVEEPAKLLPPDGVYAVRVHVSQEVFGGMMNIGMRPTVDDYPGRSIEVNLFDFDRDIYGQTLSVEILAWVRSEVKFSSLDNLKQQLAKDARRCRELLQASR